MEELTALSAKISKKNSSVDNNMVRKSTSSRSRRESFLSEEDYLKSSTQSNIAEPSCPDKKRSNLSREVLLSLFNAPERSEEESKPKHLEWGLNRSRVVGTKPVTKPFDDFFLSTKTEEPKVKLDDKKDEDDDYLILRRAVKQHWDEMKQCYEAAVIAFTDGDRKKANYLLEQGKEHKQKASEAEEKSVGEIFSTSKSDVEEEFTLDLSPHHPKEALDLLKFHLRLLANIPSFGRLKVIVDSDAKGTTKGKKKRMVMKLLAKESIKWTKEEGKPGTIFIQLDQIDPNKLKFVKDSE